jgi:hypothetical protein
MSSTFDTKLPHWLLNHNEQIELIRAAERPHSNYCFTGKYVDEAFYRAMIVDGGCPSSNSHDYRWIRLNIKSDFSNVTSNYVIVDMIAKKIFTDIEKLRDKFESLSFSSKCTLEFHEKPFSQEQITQLIDTILPGDCPPSRKRKLSVTAEESDSSTSSSETDSTSCT